MWINKIISTTAISGLICCFTGLFAGRSICFKVSWEHFRSLLKRILFTNHMPIQTP